MHGKQDEELQHDGVTGPARCRQEAVGGGQYGPVERGLVQLGLGETGRPSRRIPSSLAPVQAVQEPLPAPARRHGPRNGRGIGGMAAHAIGAARQTNAGEPDMSEKLRLDSVAGCQCRIVPVEKRPKLGKEPRHRVNERAGAGDDPPTGLSLERP